MKQKKQTSSTGPALWVGLGIVAALVVAVIASSALKGAPKTSAPETGGDLLAVASDDYVKGPAGAPVTLVEYLDFECEACGAYYPVLRQLMEDYPQDLRVVTRYFPLPGHRNGMPAALAVEAAARQGKYREMHDILFENQAAWGERQQAEPALFEAYAAQLGLDLARFKADVKDASVQERVQRDIDSGTELGNTGTPSFFLNGQKLSNPGSYEAFRAAIDQALAASRAASAASSSAQ